MIKIKEKTEIPFFILFVLITLIMLIRALFGIEITDESYYLAEGRTVLEGNLPYALNNSRVVGMTFLMIPFVWIFRFLSPDYSGYFLYMRICFIFFKCTIIMVSYFLLRSKIGIFSATCISLIMSAFHMYSIQNFSYNTISTLIVFLVSILLFSYFDSESKQINKNIAFYISGFLSAIAVFAHPAHALSVLIFLTLFFVFRTKIHFYILYILGGLTQVVVLFIFILIRCGWNKLYHGLVWYSKSMASIEHPRPETVIKNIWHEYNQLWIIMAIIFILSLVIKAIFDQQVSNKSVLGLIDKKQIYKKNIIISLFPAIIFGSFFILKKASPPNAMLFVGAISCFVICFLFLEITKVRTIWFVGLPGLFLCLFEAFMTTGNAPAGRFLHVVPAITTLFIIYGKMEVMKKRILQYHVARSMIKKLILPSLAALAIIVCEIYGLKDVYRDDHLSLLTYRVDQGVFKGIYTSEQNAKDTIELEKYVKSITKKDEYISFRDNVPIGYLFMNGHICDIRTWDCMQYTYGGNDPSALYAYYKRIDRIPDKIIYVDYGRDKELSIANNKFLYNDFVNLNYKMESDIKLNDSYKRVILFIRK